MSRVLVKWSPSIIGLTATTPLVLDAFHCADLAKRILPSANTILGGVHASIMPERCLRECDSLDFVCKGQGEHTLKELANSEDIHSIHGLVFREAGKIMINPPRVFHDDLDKFPLPARDLLQMESYMKPSPFVIRGLELRATHIFSGIGCVGNCHFCAWPGMHGRRVRLHSADYLRGNQTSCR